MKPILSRRDVVLSLIIGSIMCFFNFHLTVNPFTLYNGYDQAIFEQMGLGMLQGRIPYVDLFDHKGFLLYIINAAGLWLSPGHLGIYLILSLALSLTFLCWLHISDYLVGPSLRYFPPLISLMFACLCEGGNMTENWSLLPISISILYLVRYVCKGRMMSIIECFFIGICLGVAGNLRLNNAVPILAVCLYMLIELCYKKEFSKLALSICSVIGGFLLVSLALVAFYVSLYGSGHIGDYLFGCLGFNLRYIDLYIHRPLWKSGGLFFPLSVMIVMMCFKRNYHNRLVWFTLMAFAMTLLTTGKAYFSHYFILFAPLVCLGISLSFGKVFYVKPRTWRLIGGGLLVLLICLSYIFRSNLYGVAEKFILRERAIAECSKKLKELNEKQKKSIWNYNTEMAGAGVLQCAGLVQSNRIFLPFQAQGQYGVKEIGEVSEVCPEVILVDENTLWEEGMSVVALESRGTPSDLAFIKQNYRILYRAQTEIQKKRICIYTRSDEKEYHIQNY